MDYLFLLVHVLHGNEVHTEFCHNLKLNLYNVYTYDEFFFSSSFNIFKALDSRVILFELKNLLSIPIHTTE